MGRSWWRRFKSSTAVLLTTAVLLVGCSESDSTGTPASFDTSGYGPNLVEVTDGYYAAGITTSELEYMVAPAQDGRQRQQNWCWAACIQMILNYHGINYSQEQIVQDVFGAQIDQPADAAQILYALNGWIYQDIFGNYRLGQGAVFSEPIPVELIDLLSRRWPLIVGLENPTLDIGHAYLLTAIYFYADEYSITVDKVVLRDPWPKSESRQEVSWAEFKSRFLFGGRFELTTVSSY